MKKKRKKKLKKKGKEKTKVQQGEALPGPSLDQWHRSAEEEEDGPGMVPPSVQEGKGPLPETQLPTPCQLPLQS